MPTGRGFVMGHPSRWKFLSFALAFMTLLMAGVMPGSASAQDWSAPRTVFVPDTGHTTNGYFLDVWRTQRALLGDPVTAEFAPRSGFQANAADGEVVQYYQNLALVYLPTAPAGEQVDTLPLGAEALTTALANQPVANLLKATRRTVCPPGGADCRGFATTGHTLRGDFLTFWNTGDASRWVGAPVSEAFRAADGSVVQYLERAVLRQQPLGRVELMPLGLATAKRQGVSTDPTSRPDDVPIYDEALFTPPPGLEETSTEELAAAEAEQSAWSSGPGPQQGAWKEIVVSISAQSMWAYEGGELVMSSLVSTGTADVPETVTPIGSWSVLSKYEVTDMEGTISDEYYFVEAVPNVMYFDNLGNALHGAYWHNNFGTPMSHGCVNLPLDVAAWMFAWAPVGTAVTVIP